MTKPVAEHHVGKRPCWHGLLYCRLLTLFNCFHGNYSIHIHVYFLCNIFCLIANLNLLISHLNLFGFIDVIIIIIIIINQLRKESKWRQNELIKSKWVMGDVLLDSTLQWNRDKPRGACVGGSSHKRTSCVTTPAHAALGGTFFFSLP